MGSSTPQQRGRGNRQQRTYQPVQTAYEAMNSPYMITNAAGQKEWKKPNGELHRLDGPAKAWGPTGHENQEWWVNGKLHRDDGLPATIYSDGSCGWYQHGKLHREDGPALDDGQGTLSWYQHGQLHREDGPAVVHGNGYEEWYLHGKLHRDDDLPAVNDPLAAAQRWYQHGKMHRLDGPANVYGDGIEEWWLNGNRHREGDLPAFVYGDDHQEWWIDDDLHRDGGPARIKNGHKEWYQHGIPHRDDGPAIEWHNGKQSWYLDGKEVTEDEVMGPLHQRRARAFQESSQPQTNQPLTETLLQPRQSRQ